MATMARATAYSITVVPAGAPFHPAAAMRANLDAARLAVLKNSLPPLQRNSPLGSPALGHVYR